jgi:hypothetical protein
MAAYEVLLLNTAVPQIQAAQSGDTYVVPRDIAFSAALTLSAGTANGVPYLNASKVLTTGSALTFDGTSLGVGFTANSRGGVVMTTTNNSGASEQGGYAVTNGNGTGLFAGVNGASYSTGGIGNANNAVLYTIGNTDLVFGRNTSEQMRLTSTGLGIGTSSPLALLNTYQVSGGADANILFQNFSTTTSTAVALYLSPTNGSLTAGSIRAAFIKGINVGGGVTALTFGTNSSGADPTEKMRLDSSGNLGLGVTPSAWVDDKALQLPWGSISSGYEYGLSSVVNAYRTTSNVWLYQVSSVQASRYNQAGGAHQWFTAPSGTAGNAITFTQAMTLDASGNLGVGTTSPQNDSNYGGFTLNGTSGSIITLRAGNANSGRIYTTTVDQINIDANGTASGTILFRTGTGSTERARITSGGDFQTSSGGSVQVGGTAARATTAGTNRVDIFDGTAPVGTLANGVSFYSTAGEARVMDAAGNATLLSPHDTETNEWIFHSKHTPTGKVLRIDVERLLKFVNDHFGLDAVHEFIEE